MSDKYDTINWTLTLTFKVISFKINELPINRELIKTEGNIDKADLMMIQSFNMCKEN